VLEATSGDGIREGVVLTGILALQLPCLALLCWFRGTLRALSALRGPIDTLDIVAGLLRGGHELACLLSRHSGLRWASLRSGSELLWLLRLLLARSTFGGTVVWHEFLGGQAKIGPEC
jgi:hypothetical protein